MTTSSTFIACFFLGFMMNPILWMAIYNLIHYKK